MWAELSPGISNLWIRSAFELFFSQIPALLRPRTSLSQKCYPDIYNTYCLKLPWEKPSKPTGMLEATLWHWEVLAALLAPGCFAGWEHQPSSLPVPSSSSWGRAQRRLMCWKLKNIKKDLGEAVRLLLFEDFVRARLVNTSVFCNRSF